MSGGCGRAGSGGSEASAPPAESVHGRVQPGLFIKGNLKNGAGLFAANMT